MTSWSPVCGSRAPCCVVSRALLRRRVVAVLPPVVSAPSSPVSSCSASRQRASEPTTHPDCQQPLADSGGTGCWRIQGSNHWQSKGKTRLRPVADPWILIAPGRRVDHRWIQASNRSEIEGALKSGFRRATFGRSRPRAFDRYRGLRESVRSVYAVIYIYHDHPPKYCHGLP